MRWQQQCDRFRNESSRVSSQLDSATTVWLSELDTNENDCDFKLDLLYISFPAMVHHTHLNFGSEPKVQ